MKIILDIPSAAVGGLVGLLVAAASVQSGWLLAYGSADPYRVAADVAVLCGSALLLVAYLRFREVPGSATSGFSMSVATRADARSPTASPIGMDWDAVPAALDPATWLVENLRGHAEADFGDDPSDAVEALRNATMNAMARSQTAGIVALQDRVRLALRRQVGCVGTRHPDLVRAVIVAIRVARMGGAEDPRRAIDELAGLAWKGLMEGSSIPFGAFAEKHEKLQPKLLVRSRHSERHHYPATRLLAELDLARKEASPVLASDFLWLKAADRTIWHAANSLGRPSFLVEGAGVMSHYRAERLKAYGMVEPAIENDAYDRLKAYFVRNGMVTPLNPPESPAEKLEPESGPEGSAPPWSPQPPKRSDT